MHEAAEPAVTAGSPAARSESTNEPLDRTTRTRAPELVVDRVRELIRTQQLRPGTRLPPERDLSARFGVGRITVREALRVLESLGLVKIRVGARGGAFVVSPDASRISENLVEMLTITGISQSDVREARLLFEVGLLPYACRRATAADVASLYNICRSEAVVGTSPRERATLAAAFHQQLAACVHNPAVTMLAQSLRSSCADGGVARHPATPRRGSSPRPPHEALLKAIAARDEHLSVALLRAHLG